MSLPLVDVVVAGSGRKPEAGKRYCESIVGERMRYVSHTMRENGPWQVLTVVLQDAATSLVASLTYEILMGGGVVRSWTKLANAGSSQMVLESVTSFLGNGMAGPGGALGDVDVLWAENDWLSESRWQVRDLRDALPDLNRRAALESF